MAGTETTRRHPLVEDYLQRLEGAARKLPRARRKELIAETEAYFDQAIKPEAGAVEVRGMLGALGTPEALVAQDRPKAKPQPDALEVPAITLVAFGGLFIGVGWFFGVYLLWRSRVFTVSDKLIGTLLWPGGMASALIVAIVILVSDVTAGPLIAIGVLAVPLLSAWYLLRRVRRAG
jgi:uncharacterized membrane protein